MAWIVAVLAMISLVAGGFLGTFRHRAYGVWSLAGVLIAIVTANIVGTSVGIWMAASIGTTEASPVLVLVKTSMLVVISLIISYYASDLIPAQIDPKTRSDNIMAGLLGVFNAYLIVSTILVYVLGLNNEFSATIFGNGQNFNFNRMFVDGLPWLTSILVLYIVGWSSVRKFKQAWARLRGTSSTTPPATGSTTTGTNYSYSSPATGFTPSFPSSSGASVTPPAAEHTEKKGWFSGWGSWFRRDEKSTESDVNSTNAQASGQAPLSPSYPPATYQGTSGATPPYGISTGNTGYNSGYNTASTSGSTYTNTSTNYTAPSYTTGYTATPTAPASTPGYSSTTSYTPPATNPGYSSTYTPSAPSSSSYPSSYGGTATTSSTNYSPTSTGSSAPSAYNSYTPSQTSGFAPTNTPSAGDAALGGLAAGGVVAGGLFGATYNPAVGSDFSNMNDYQDNDEENDFYGEEEDDDAQDGYSSGYRG